MSGIRLRYSWKNYIGLFLVWGMVVFSFSVNSVYGQPNCVTNSGYPAAVTEELFDKAVTYITQKDRAALQQLLDTKMVIILKSGVAVYLEDTKIFSGKAKFRLPGSTISLWTNIEAITCK